MRSIVFPILFDERMIGDRGFSTHTARKKANGWGAEHFEPGRPAFTGSVQGRLRALTIRIAMAKTKEQIFEVACLDCGAMLRIDAASGLVVSHTPAPRKRMFEDLETAAKAMREQNERKESIFRQSVEAEKNKEDLFEKKFAEALRKAKDAPEGKPLREFDLD
jgi:hypothetical protein